MISNKYFIILRFEKLSTFLIRICLVRIKLVYLWWHCLHHNWIRTLTERNREKSINFFFSGVSSWDEEKSKRTGRNENAERGLQSFWRHWKGQPDQVEKNISMQNTKILQMYPNTQKIHRNPMRWYQKHTHRNIQTSGINCCVGTDCDTITLRERVCSSCRP